MVQIAETQATNYMQLLQVEDVYNFYVDEEANGGQVDETTADALKVFSTIESDYGKFQQFKPVNLEDEDDKTIQEVDDKVVVTLYAECAEKEAIVKATFVDNSVTYNFQKYSVMAQNQYSEEEADQMLASNGVYPYKISEFEVAANQTLKDKMKDAGANTLIGMGIVFILIFISFIFHFKYVPALLDKETREKRKAEKAKKALGSVATLNVDKEDETPAGSAPAQAGIVDIVQHSDPMRAL
ncbi:MAG: OadG family transporter subunit [Coprococcus sp.]